MLRTGLRTGALLLLLLILGLGVARVFGLRYAKGDVYPPYSTLRSDPLGTRILLEALDRIDRLTARRNLGPLQHLWEDPGETIFLLGVAPAGLDSDASDDDLEIEALVRQGARAVIAAAPVAWTPAADAPAAGEPPDGTEDDQGKNGRDGDRKKTPAWPPIGQDLSPEGSKRQPLGRLLGFQIEQAPLPSDQDGAPVADVARLAAGRGTGLDLPETLPWHTSLCFTKLGPDWRVIYARGGRAVLIERDLGRGSLVLSADSFVLSNEALSREPRAPLVSWLVGGNRTVIFDETHLGVAEQPGVASLMRRYRLEGFVVAILLVAGLFVWRASVSFVPPPPDPGDGGDETVTGRDAAAGLVTILRRGIPPAEILRVCRKEWTKTFENRRPDLVAALEALTEEAADPVEGYRRISRTLKEMKVHYER